MTKGELKFIEDDFFYFKRREEIWTSKILKIRVDYFWTCRGQCSTDVLRRSFSSGVNDIPDDVVDIFKSTCCFNYNRLHFEQIDKLETRWRVFISMKNETWGVSLSLNCTREAMSGFKVTYGLLVRVHAIKVRPRRKQMRSRFSRTQKLLLKSGTKRKELIIWHR